MYRYLILQIFSEITKDFCGGPLETWVRADGASVKRF